MEPATRTAIKGFLEAFIDSIVEALQRVDRDPRKPRPASVESPEGRRKPFHEAILPHGILTITEFERSFSTRMGTTFEEAARLVALEKFVEVERGYAVTGTISEGAASAIERLVEAGSSGYIRGRFPEFVQTVLSSDDGPRREMREIADLRILDAQGNETLFEIKSPKPNKGQCLEATQRLLRMHAIRGISPPRVRAFYAMAYNPWGQAPETYAHSFGNNYLDMTNEVLLGGNFWEYIGGPQTQEDLLAVYQEVGREKGPDMIDRLALNY